MSICFVTPSTSILQSHIPLDTYTIHQIDANRTNQLNYLVAMPQNPDPSLAPLILIHGILRDAAGMLKEITKRLSPASGQVIIAPVFDRKKWHGYQRVLENCRADLALLSLLETIKSSNIADASKVELLGYSGGAQFAHRFALLYPHLMKRITLCSAGWYTFPDNSSYPYGLSVPDGGMPGLTIFTRKSLASFLKLPIGVYVGENDTEIDKYTRTGKDIDNQQGQNRLQRASNWVNALKSAASELGIQPKIKLHVLEGCGHDFRQCLTHGKLAEYIFPNHP